MNNEDLVTRLKVSARFQRSRWWYLVPRVAGTIAGAVAGACYVPLIGGLAGAFVGYKMGKQIKINEDNWDIQGKINNLKIRGKHILDQKEYVNERKDTTFAYSVYERNFKEAPIEEAEEQEEQEQERLNIERFKTDEQYRRDVMEGNIIFNKKKEEKKKKWKKIYTMALRGKSHKKRKLEDITEKEIRDSFANANPVEIWEEDYTHGGRNRLSLTAQDFEQEIGMIRGEFSEEEEQEVDGKAPNEEKYSKGNKGYLCFSSVIAETNNSERKQVTIRERVKPLIGVENRIVNWGRAYRINILEGEKYFIDRDYFNSIFKGTSYTIKDDIGGNVVGKIYKGWKGRTKTWAYSAIPWLWSLLPNTNKDFGRPEYYIDIYDDEINTPLMKQQLAMLIPSLIEKDGWKGHAHKERFGTYTKWEVIEGEDGKKKKIKKKELTPYHPKRLEDEIGLGNFSPEQIFLR